MSPQLLLVLIVAYMTASAAGLLARAPFYFLPVFWVLGVVSLLVGQVIGRAASISFFNVGLVELGTGLVVNLVMLLGFRYAVLWYNRKGTQGA